jgi:hypothetical protein
MEIDNKLRLHRIHTDTSMLHRPPTLIVATTAVRANELQALEDEITIPSIEIELTMSKTRKTSLISLKKGRNSPCTPTLQTTNSDIDQIMKRKETEEYKMRTLKLQYLLGQKTVNDTTTTLFTSPKRRSKSLITQTRSVFD